MLGEMPCADCLVANVDLVVDQHRMLMLGDLLLRSDGRHMMDTVRTRMHKGSVAALNLYSLNLQNDLLGYACCCFAQTSR